MKTSLTILLTIFALSNALELPETLKPCRKSDPEYMKCLNEVVASFITSLAPGMKSLHILPLEPLMVDRIKIGEKNGPVSLKQDYTNVKIYGLTKGLTLENYKIDFDKLLLTSDAKIPKVELIADYEVDGKVLILPVRGKGSANITIVNLGVMTTIQLEKYDKDGETYVRVVNYSNKFTPENVLLNFDNLFDGDKVLGDQLNSFLGENSALVFKEMQGSFEESFNLIFKTIANNVFSRFPMMTLFPEK